MKKLLFAPLVICAVVLACQKSGSSKTEEETDVAATEAVQRKCAAAEVLEEQMAADPEFRKRRMQIDAAAENFVTSGAYRLVNGVLEIPVVVNVLYRTSTENISLDQINSQIEVLNEDFNNTNADRTKVPAEFTDEQAAVGYKFVLAAVNRKSSSKKSWSTNDDMKRSSRGGIDPTDPSKNLNLWVVNKMTSFGSTILGYAQFPGGSPATDGVVIGYNFFGRRGVLSAPFNLGRTATHEVGHWMNLRHIWGDATCGNDFVDDTPTAHRSNYGCPGVIAGCVANTREMTMNYMDYTDDPCMYMFTTGQKARMDATFFGTNAPRATFAQ